MIAPEMIRVGWSGPGWRGAATSAPILRLEAFPCERQAKPDVLGFRPELLEAWQLADARQRTARAMVADERQRPGEVASGEVGERRPVVRRETWHAQRIASDHLEVEADLRACAPQDPH